MLPVLIFFLRTAVVLGTSACFCYNLAHQRGLEPGAWATMGAFLGPFGVLLIFLAEPPAQPPPSGGRRGQDPRPPARPRSPQRGPSSGGKRPRVRMPQRVR
ncbi:MAG: hypothetical protein AAFQ53_15085 [Bacteroidota bacterium]